MPDDTITLPAPALEKIAQLAQLLEQAERLAREISEEMQDTVSATAASHKFWKDLKDANKEQS